MPRSLWIDGQFIAALSSGEIDVLNPYTEQVIGTVPKGTAVDAARAAFRTWRTIPAVERADFLHEVARRLRDLEMPLGLQLTCICDA
jgi:lactaldehyde dehydrogenase/glycolaldehyde dehydrogenase